jgi:AcrR family transcriptional regulator
LVRAAQVEFSRAGYTKATARSIAARAGVAVGSFYQYFTDKDALLRELAAERLARIAAATVGAVDADADRLTEPPTVAVIRRSMRGVVAALVAYHREDPGLHAVLAERRHADPELEAMTGASERAFVGKIAELLGRWSTDVDRDATAFVIFAMVEGAVHAHVLGDPYVSDDRFHDALVDALVRVALPPQEME